jgi:glycogen synthase kinase 3 beta
VKKLLNDKKFKSRELELLQKLTHPNILGLKDYFEEKSHTDVSKTYLNLVSDYYPETLSTVMKYFKEEKKKA